MSFPVNRKADPAFRQLPFGTVNRESEFTHMRTGPVGYHNNDALVGINMWQETNMAAEKQSFSFRWRLCGTENLYLLFSCALARL